MSHYYPICHVNITEYVTTVLDLKDLLPDKPLALFLCMYISSYASIIICRGLIKFYESKCTSLLFSNIYFLCSYNYCYVFADVLFDK